MKDYDENKESSYLKYSNVNNLYGLEMPQKWPVYYFKWVEEISEFNEDFIKDITMIVMKDTFLKMMLNILKNYPTFTTIYPFCLKE